MQYIILFLDIRNWEIKRRRRSIDAVAENYPRCYTKIIGACMYHWTSCTYKKLCMDWDFIRIMLCYSQYCRCMVSISDKHLKEETMMRVWKQNNYPKSPITWFRGGVDFGAASRLVTRLESCFECLVWKQSNYGRQVLYKLGWLQSVNLILKSWISCLHFAPQSCTYFMFIFTALLGGVLLAHSLCKKELWWSYFFHKTGCYFTDVISIYITANIVVK